MTAPERSSGPRRIALALQGGGSHTAFTAGVLSRWFSSDAFTGCEIVGVSGTSGGAINALITWATLVRGRPGEVGEALDRFWDDNAARTPAERLLNAVMVGGGVAQSLGLAPPLNPYLLPAAADGREEFRRLLRRHVDFDALPVDTAARHPRLVLGAVDVLSGQFRAFDSRRDRITADSVLASAAIPTLFRTIRTDGGAYWDGLFSQNPPVAQLVESHPDELWVVQINPSRRATEPRTTLDIADRRNELAGNLSLYQELNGIEKVDRLLEAGVLVPGHGYRPIMIRVLEMPRSPQTGLLGAASKLNRDARFLDALRRAGREQAGLFLDALTFERAWTSADAERLRELLRGASITVTPPFAAPRDPAGFAERMLAADVAVDASRKQLAAEQVTWRVRVRRDADAAPLVGEAVVTFAAGRVASLLLRPVP